MLTSLWQASPVGAVVFIIIGLILLIGSILLFKESPSFGSFVRILAILPLYLLVFALVVLILKFILFLFKVFPGLMIFFIIVVVILVL